MKISVKVKPRSSEQKLEKLGKDEHSNEIYKVSVKSAPEKGKANNELIEVLAKHFDVAPSSVRIVKGHKARSKIVEI